MQAKLLHISRILILLLFLVWLTGEIFRDKTHLTGVLFFLPSPFVALVLLISGFLYRRWQQPKWAKLYFTLSILPLLFDGCIENQFIRAKPEKPPNTLTLIHWNLWWDTMGPKKQIAKIRSLDADLFALSEAPDQLDNLKNFHSLRKGPFLILSKHPITLLNNLSKPPISSLLVNCQTPQGDLRILLSDLPSGVQFHRYPMHNQMLKQLESHNPDIWVGDFNSPRRSLALQTLPNGYQHAYETVGSGLSYSYPPFLPFLSLDQCIHSPNIHPIRYNLQSTFLSDHKMQVFEFTVKDG